MKRRRSLSFRLVGYLFVVQMLLIMMTPIFAIAVATSGLNPAASRNLNEWGEEYARNLVLAALKRGPDGAAYIEGEPALTNYLNSAPSFLYAAWDAGSGEAFPGSSPLLLDALRAKWSPEVTSMRFQMSKALDPGLVGVLRQANTPFGQVVVAVYGYTFHMRDAFYLMSMMFNSVALLMFSPLILPATFLAFFLVRRGLAPLRVAASKAARIDIDSPEIPIRVEDVPEEVLPFVTAVNDALKRVRQSVAAQQRFLANAAHELRTPITVLCSRIDNPDEATFMQDIKRDARRIRTMVEQLLSAAKIANNADGVINEVVDVRQLVLAMVLDYMPLAVASNRNIEFDRPPEPAIVRCDPHALERVILNLVENACRAEPERGSVIVRVHPGVTIEVVDHGEGVHVDDREKIFEPFWRKSGATPGAGLGLAITKEIVEAHGGAISVAETPNGGATFRVTLPPAEGAWRKPDWKAQFFQGTANFHGLLTSWSPKQSASTSFCRRTVQSPAKPKPFFNQSIASKPAIVSIGIQLRL